MILESSPRLLELLRDVVLAPRVARAATCAVAFWDGAKFQGYVAAAGEIPSQQGIAPVLADTPFDLASITKSFTALTCGALIADGSLRWSTSLHELLPELKGTWGGAQRIDALLSHRSGLAAHREFFRSIRERKPWSRARALREAASAKHDGSSPCVYSDLGYLLVGEALERHFGPLDHLIASRVTRPLGLGRRTVLGSARQHLRADPAFLQKVAPTETVAYRGGVIRGRVHDDNAWAFAGHSVAGHAGLFGSALGLTLFGTALLTSWRDGAPWSTLTRQLHDPEDGGSYRLGFDTKASGASSASNEAGPRTFGHLGFTGTSLWCDPDAQVVSVLLTNRVAPTRDNFSIRPARPQVHAELFRMARHGY